MRVDPRHRKTFIVTGAAVGAFAGALATRNDVRKSNVDAYLLEVSYAVAIAMGAAVGALIGWLVYRLTA